MNSIQTYNITEADVLAWLNERATSAGIPGLFIKIGTGGQSHPVVIGIEDVPGSFGFGSTINAALENAHSMNRLSLHAIAAYKRQLAARLTAEAEALVPQLVVAEKEGAAA